MDCLNAVRVLTFFAFVQVINGQTATLTGSSTVQQGTDTALTCNVNGGTATQYVWIDSSVTPAQTIYSGGNRFSGDSKYTNFQLTSETDTAAVMTIENTAVEDEGTYLCSIPSNQGGSSNTLDLVVEVQSTRSLTLRSSDDNNEDRYIATCLATGGKPMETITWILNGSIQVDGINGNIIETTPTPVPPLFNIESVFTFPANVDNYEQTLVCNITGHTLIELNGQESIELNIHTSPFTARTNVTVDYVTQGTAIIVSCNAEREPTPTMRNYYIYSNGSLIHESTDGTNEYTVSDPVIGTNYTCLAGNYLGNTTISKAVTYDPTRPTTPSTTTESSTAEGTTTERPADMMTSPEPNDGNETGPPSGPGGLSAGATAGIAIGAVLLIVIIVLIIYFVWKKGKDGPSAASSTKKHGSSTVGTSNGSEKDKIKPVAAPRDQGSIQHTTDNPGQAEYAMVDRKKPGGGDVPDTRGPGQKEPQGMLYADLDLSASAGHTEKKVPQNKDDVVVYSSILV